MFTKSKTVKNDSRKKGKKIGYVRVSDKDQTENLQIDALKAAGCDMIYGDHGVSGSIKKRKGLDEMLASLKDGDTLVVWKLDRLGRSTIHLLQLLNDLRQRNVDFQAITQGIDTTTAVGRMLYGQLSVFAEFEREQIRERTKAGMASAKARGKHIGRPRKLTKKQILMAKVHIDSGSTLLNAINKYQLQVSTSTLMRELKTLKPQSETDAHRR